MESRLIPIQSLDDFFDLVDLASETDKKTLLTDYAEILPNLIQSTNNARLFVKKARVIIEPFSLFELHPHLFINAFHSAEDFIDFCRNKDKLSNFQVHRIVGKNALTKKVSDLFTMPESVVELTKFDSNIAQGLFQDNIPCAQQIVHDRNPFNSLKSCAGTTSFYHGNMALCATMHIANCLDDDKQPDLESVLDFAYAFANMPRRFFSKDNIQSYVYIQPNTDNYVDVESHLLERFRAFLRSGKHAWLINLLSTRNDFLKLFNLSQTLAFEFLNHANLIKILFPNGILLEGLKVIAKEYPALAEDLFKKLPEQISALFKTIAQFREFYEYCGKDTKVIANNIPVVNVIKLYSTTSDMSDWTWLAQHSMQKKTESPYYNYLTNLANGVFVLCGTNVQAVFSNAQNITQVVSVSPYYTDTLIENLRKAKIEPETFFADAETFWQFLQAGGTHLLNFSKLVLAKYPQHFVYIHAQTNQFRTLDRKFLGHLLDNHYREFVYEMIDNVSKTFREHGGIAVGLEVSGFALGWGDKKPDELLDFAKSRDDLLAILKRFNVGFMTNHPTIPENREMGKYVASKKCRIPALLQKFRCPDILNQLGEINPKLLTALIKHHSSEMLLLTNIQAFLKLKLEHCIEFINQEPEFFAFAIAVISFDEIVDFLKRNEWELNRDDNAKHLNALFARAASIVAKAFVATSGQIQASAIKKHFLMIQTLLSHAPTIMAQEFSGAAFVKLIEINAAVARELLTKNKDNLAVLIPTTAGIDAINKQNPMLLAMFKKQFPTEWEAHLKTLENATPSPAKANRWCTFYPAPQQAAASSSSSSNSSSRGFHIGWIV